MGIDRLLGTWDVTMQHVAVPEPVRARQRYERVLDGAFVLLHWTYEHPDFPDALAVLDDTTLQYFDVRGVTRTFTLQVDETGWSMERRDPDFWQRSHAVFRGDDAMEGSGANSSDGGATWQHDYAVTYVRVVP